MQMVHSLEEIQPENVDIHGGKAANLAKLVNLGFHVPRGIAISSAAFSQMVRANQNLGKYLTIVDETEDFEEILEISGNIQQTIGTYEFPIDIVSEISKRIDNFEETDIGFECFAIEHKNPLSVIPAELLPDSIRQLE